jgi:predicted outer membrane repeat protein
VPGVAHNGASISDIGAFEVQGETPSLVVTTGDDVVDLFDNQTSLREALALANSTAAADTIAFAASLAGQTLTLTQGALAITTSLTINGDTNGDGQTDITISGDADHSGTHNTGDSRVFFISDGAASAITVALDGLVIEGGYTADRGGGIYVGSGEILMLSNTTITDSLARSHGGGIYAASGSAVTLTNSTLSHNVADPTAGNGGGIFGVGSITLINATVSDNEARWGGGIDGHQGTITVTNSTVSANSAYYSGGGIYGKTDVTINLMNSTVSGNDAGARGGGIYGWFHNTITLINATVTGNYAAQTGGGIEADDGGLVTLDNSLVAGNFAPNPGVDLFGRTFSNLVLNGGNILGSAADSFNQTTNNGTLISIDGTSQAGLETVFAAVGNDPHTGVLSGVLADNGGPVQTVALSAAPSNPALDGGDDLLASTEDARGVLRADVPGVAHNGSNISDIGAFELAETPSLIVTTATDIIDPFDNLTSLREALALANSTVAADTVTFDASLAGSTLVLTSSSTLAITTNLTIDGDIDQDGRADIIISGDADQSGTHTVGDIDVFRVDDGNASTSISASLNGLIIRDGQASSGGGIFVGQSDTLTLTHSELINNRATDFGGGIANQGTSVLSDVTLSDNDGAGSTRGGGIWNFGQLSLTNVTLSGSDTGGVGGGLENSGAATLTNVTIADSSASGAGGGVYNDGTITLYNTTLSDNVSSLSGGGIVNASGGVAGLTNTTLWGNRSFSDGGGISNESGATATLTNVTVTGNTAAQSGGGIDNDAGGGLTLTNSIVAGNAAVTSDADVNGTLNLTGGNIVGDTFTTNGSSPLGGIALDDIFASVVTGDPDGFGGNPEFAFGVLADNGGPVQTVALTPDVTNPAVDAGDPAKLDETQASVPDLNGDADQLDTIATDARGLPRHVDVGGAPSAPDLGAVELQPSLSLVVDTLSDETYDGGDLAAETADGHLSLREASASPMPIRPPPTRSPSPARCRPAPSSSRMGSS